MNLLPQLESPSSSGVKWNPMNKSPSAIDEPAIRQHRAPAGELESIGRTAKVRQYFEILDKRVKAGCEITGRR